MAENPSNNEEVKSKGEKSMEQEVIETLVNELLETFMKKIKEGMNELSIPSFDPLDIAGNRDIDVDNFFAKMKGNFREFKLTGLSSIPPLPKLELKDEEAKGTTTTKL